MTGVALLGTFVVVAYIVYWAIANDSDDDSAEQKGFLRMRGHAAQKDGD